MATQRVLRPQVISFDLDVEGQLRYIKYTDEIGAVITQSFGPTAYERWVSDPDAESLRKYVAGGFHPVHLGAKFGLAGRYEVIHKLEYDDEYTTWLCRDSQGEGSYVALRIYLAHLAADDIFELRLARLDCSAPGAEYVALPLDHFTVDGPNGTHQCITLPLLGEECVDDMRTRLRQGTTNLAPLMDRMADQSNKAMNFLQENGVCHRELDPSNVRIKLANIDALPKTEVLDNIFGKPERIKVKTKFAPEHPVSTPAYLVKPYNMARGFRNFPTSTSPTRSALLGSMSPLLARVLAIL